MGNGKDARPKSCLASEIGTLHQRLAGKSGSYLICWSEMQETIQENSADAGSINNLIGIKNPKIKEKKAKPADFV